MSKTVTSGGAFPTTSKVIDVYQAGHIAYETDGAGTTLASFAYDPHGTPTSVTVGSNQTTDSRYYYVYSGHGDVVALVESGGSTVATYSSYDPFGNQSSIWESFTNGWTNPYRYDGLDDVRYDGETGLYWMSVRAYDPTLGRFLTHDPLGRNQGTWSTQPYAYAANNPLRNIDPNGQIPMGVTEENGNAYFHRKLSTTITTTPGNDPSGGTSCSQSSHCMDQYRKWKAWLDPVLSGGLLGAAFFDVTVFGLEGIPLAGEIAALWDDTG